MKRAIYCGLISAVVGFLVAAWEPTISPAVPRWMGTAISYILCPPGILAGMTMTDPDAESIWLLFGPLNAVIYGVVGFALWLRIVGNDDESLVAKYKDRERPLDL